ncbi:hypothetical protein [Aquimarina algiphila]|uniref:hypothetical protein n=1 Tax=Aquimarina algiphila TaxID=2047982 RepID=UPI00249204B8|nr:hypothetical protein [Aquimarina algiphila]
MKKSKLNIEKYRITKLDAMRSIRGGDETTSGVIGDTKPLELSNSYSLFCDEEVA